MADKIINPAAASSAASGKPKSGLGVLALASIVISSMIGGGIYSLPQNMAAGASAGADLAAAGAGFRPIFEFSSLSALAMT